jgi:hypothetical protein
MPEQPDRDHLTTGHYFTEHWLGYLENILEKIKL